MPVNCECTGCSYLTNGGTLVIISPDCFAVEPRTSQMGMGQVSNLINLFKTIYNLNYTIIDNGLLDKIRTSYPFSTEPTVRPYYQTLIRTVQSCNKINYIHHSEINEFDTFLSMIIRQYRGREIIIIKQEGESGYVTKDGKEFYVWNIASENSFTFLRKYIHSPKHFIWSKDITETYNPMLEHELDCALSRSVSIEDYNSFSNLDQQLYSYNERYKLIIKNHKTRDYDRVIQISGFAQKIIDIKVKEVEYHGYQISKSEKNVLSLLRDAKIKSVLNESQYERDFRDNELSMYKDMGTSESLIKKIQKKYAL